MTKYVKVRPVVAEHLRLKGTRNMLPDGNYLLWQSDMLAFGTLGELDAIATRIGAVLLTHAEARAEQDGVTCAELPDATDNRFKE